MNEFLNTEIWRANENKLSPCLNTVNKIRELGKKAEMNKGKPQREQEKRKETVRKTLDHIRWTTEYIKRNPNYWECKRKEGEQESQRKLNNWDNQIILEKIKTLKR